jgi:hypothetical protein
MDVDKFDMDIDTEMDTDMDMDAVMDKENGHDQMYISKKDFCGARVRSEYRNLEPRT